MLVRIHSLRLSREGVRILDDVHLSLAAGEIYGLLGANGAGKTTTLRMLATILEPTEGTAIVAGYDVAKEPQDLNQPALRLHPLKGDLKGHWSVWVNGNWRITFGWIEGDATDVDLEDYH